MQLRAIIRLPRAAEMEFEVTGSAEECATVLDSIRSILREEDGRGEAFASESGDALEEGSAVDLRSDLISVAARREALERAGATTHIERITVFVQLALDAGRRGLDLKTADTWFREVGIAPPKPSSFWNASRSGYLVSEGKGLWRTTPAGERFAHEGVRLTPSEAKANGRRRMR